MGHGTENDPTGTIDTERAERLAVTLQAVADPDRLRALTALREGPRTLDAMAREVDVDDATLRTGLDRLADLGLVTHAGHDDASTPTSTVTGTVIVRQSRCTWTQSA